jgi:hypothetical protein
MTGISSELLYKIRKTLARVIPVDYIDEEWRRREKNKTSAFDSRGGISQQYLTPLSDDFVENMKRIPQFKNDYDSFMVNYTE